MPLNNTHHYSLQYLLRIPASHYSTLNLEHRRKSWWTFFFLQSYRETKRCVSIFICDSELQEGVWQRIWKTDQGSDGPCIGRPWAKESLHYMSLSSWFRHPKFCEHPGALGFSTSCFYSSSTPPFQKSFITQGKLREFFIISTRPLYATGDNTWFMLVWSRSKFNSTYHAQDSWWRCGYQNKRYDSYEKNKCLAIVCQTRSVYHFHVIILHLSSFIN